MAGDLEVRPEIEAVMQAAAAAHERFLQDDKALEAAWAAGNVNDVLDQMRKRLIDEYSGAGTAAGSESGAG